MSRFVLALILFGLSTGVGFGQEVTVELTNSIGMKLVLIPKGTFMMGSPESEEGRDADEVQHEVTLSNDFFLGVTEVTQAQYQKVIGENPSYFQGDKVQGDSSNHPV
ncbi:MAG: formylglycine-generating enzyme family protein, partial [Planctomycetota bacterium]